VHGGLLCALLDEAIGYAGHFQGIKGVTGKLEVRIRRPTPIGEPLFIAATIIKRTRKLIRARATISLADNTAVAEGTALIYILPQSQGNRMN
jgi:acyl-coenzyme A thioesterase PaaI-like protein